MTPDFSRFLNKEASIAVVGLGYVGLPLAVALARRFQVVGFDIAETRIAALTAGTDHTGEVSPDDLQQSAVRFTADPAMLSEAELIIVAVPTPIDRHRNPDLSPVLLASETVGRNMRQGAVVVYESTVYPGVTEDACVPLLEQFSGFTCGIDFTVGYSPERINPGDKVYTVENIVKVVSGSTPETLDLLAAVYGETISAGIHKAPSIRVAEAAKVIENTQRDLNIALMNELSLIFDRLGLDTLDVLAAAGTKWNFLPFRPGLVGGHCIGVDPYYLTYKAEEAGYHPQVILAGRRINDSMGKFIAEKTVKMLIAADLRVRTARVGILGFTFKENVPDLRNTRVIDICRELEEYGCSVLVHDPLADAGEALTEYGIDIVPFNALQSLDALILAVRHDIFGQYDLPRLQTCFADTGSAILLDVKGAWTPGQAADLGFTYWRL